MELNDFFAASRKSRRHPMQRELQKMFVRRAAELRRAQQAIRDGHIALANKILERVAKALENAAAQVAATK